MAKQNDTLEDILDLVDDISKKLVSQQTEIKAIKEKVFETNNTVQTRKCEENRCRDKTASL